MTWRLLLAVVAIPVAASAPLETQLATGLDVVVEKIAEPLVVDGVGMTMQRVRGAGVPELARRIESRWKSHGSEIQSLQQGTWVLRSRMRGDTSEVMQWRAGTGGYELVWSSLDVSAPVNARPDAGLVLPATCIWGRSVSGRSITGTYLQRAARCSLRMPELSRHLQGSLPGQGWRVRTAGGNGLLLERPGAEGLLSLSTMAGNEGTWVSWLHVEHSK